VTGTATDTSLVVDVWVQQPTERFMSAPWLETLLRWTGADRRVISVQDTLDAMDASGVGIALLSAWGTPQGMLIDNDEVAAVVQQAPDRFKGVASVDLRDPVRAVQEIRRCVGDLGFVGVRVVPWVWDLPPDDRRYYPVYVACVERRCRSAPRSATPARCAPRSQGGRFPTSTGCSWTSRIIWRNNHAYDERLRRIVDRANIACCGTSPMGNQVKAAKTQAWRLQVAPARHQAVAACARCPGPGGRSAGVTSPTGGSVSAAMHAVSRRRI
jgi:hypothetical protein